MKWYHSKYGQKKGEKENRGIRYNRIKYINNAK